MHPVPADIFISTGDKPGITMSTLTRWTAPPFPELPDQRTPRFKPWIKCSHRGSPILGSSSKCLRSPPNAPPLFSAFTTVRLKSGHQLANCPPGHRFVKLHQSVVLGAISNPQLFQILATEAAVSRHRALQIQLRRRRVKTSGFNTWLLPTTNVNELVNFNELSGIRGYTTRQLATSSSV